MRILVVSDLHVGEGAVCTDLSTGTSSNAVKHNFLEELKFLAHNENLKADYLLIAGDITNRAKPEEFSLAAKKIKEIASFFSIIEEKNILFVPGNHDSNWFEEERVLTSGTPNVNIAIKEKYRFIQHEPLFDTILRNADYGCFYNAPYFAIWNLEKINIIGINTSVFDHYNKKPHHGTVRHEDIKHLDRMLTKLNISNSNKFNLVMLHHHPIQQPDLPFSDADHSILQNSSNLMDVLFKNRVNFIIHGHKHIPTLGNHSNDYNHPITILCSGSFSARLDDRYFQGVPNMIHLIEIEDKCKTHKTIKGFVKSWEHNTGHGWERDRSKNGIGYIEFFGNAMSRFDIESLIKKEIDKAFATQTHIKWSDLTTSCKELQYTPRKLLDIILTNLEQELKFKRFDRPSSDELFILLKD